MSLTRFVIVFVGVKVKENVKNPDKPRFVFDIQTMGEDFQDAQAAEKFAKENIEAYLPEVNGYASRTTKVEAHSPLGSSNSARERASEITRNDLTEKLDPLVDSFNEQFWSSNRQREFMNNMLKDKLAECSTEREQMALRARYMMQVCWKEKEVELRYFHKKLSDDYVQAQIFNRIFRFLFPEGTETEAASATN